MISPKTKLVRPPLIVNEIINKIDMNTIEKSYNI